MSKKKTEKGKLIPQLKKQKEREKFLQMLENPLGTIGMDPLTRRVYLYYKGFCIDANKVIGVIVPDENDIDTSSDENYMYASIIIEDGAVIAGLRFPKQQLIAYGSWAHSYSIEPYKSLQSFLSGILTRWIDFGVSLSQHGPLGNTDNVDKHIFCIRDLTQYSLRLELTIESFCEGSKSFHSSPEMKFSTPIVGTPEKTPESIMMDKLMAKWAKEEDELVMDYLQNMEEKND